MTFVIDGASEVFDEPDPLAPEPEFAVKAQIVRPEFDFMLAHGANDPVDVVDEFLLTGAEPGDGHPVKLTDEILTDHG